MLARALRTMFAVFLLGALPPIALAQTADSSSTRRQAQQLVERGLDLRRRQRHAAALELFEEAHRLAPSPQTRAQIGLAQRALNHWLDAHEMLGGALEAEADPWVRPRLAELRQAFESVRDHIGEVVVRAQTTDSGIKVYVGGAERGELPLQAPLFVEAGRHDIELRKDGVVLAVQRASIDARTTVNVDFGVIASTQAAPANATATEPVASVPSTETTAPPAATAIDSAPASDSSTILTISGWTAIGAGAAALVVGGVFHGLREGAANDYNDRDECGVVGQPNAACAGLASDVRTDEAVMIAGYVVGGAAVAAGVVLLALPRSHEERATSSIRCAPTFGTWGASCGGTF